MNPNFEKLFSPIRTIGMTPAEKHAGRLKLARSMNQPTGLVSPFVFRYAVVGAFAFLLFIGTGTGLVFASQSALPGQRLYPIKLEAEQIHKLALISPAAKAEYDLGLIEKRFSEVNQLISHHALDDKSENAATLAIQSHAKDVKAEADTLATTAPAEALSYSTKLAKTLTTGTSILLAISDQSPSRAATLARKPSSLVLATYATAQKLSADTAQLELMVMNDTDAATVKTADRKYQSVLALLQTHNIVPTTPVTTATPALATAATLAAPATMAAKQLAPIENTEKMISETAIAPAEAPVAPVPAPEPAIDTKKIQDLADKLQAAYDAKKYGEVVIIADQIEQEFHDSEKIQAVEKAYNITVPDTNIKTETPIDLQTNNTSSTETSANTEKSTT